MITQNSPAPVVLPEEPDTIDPAPTEPAPDSPLRISPRPGHTPNPSTDPRQFGHPQMSQYFGPVPDSLKTIAGQASPFGKTGLPQSVIKAAMQEELNVYADMSYPWTHEENFTMMHEMEALQSGHEEGIKQWIIEYLLELYGPECGLVLKKTEIEFSPNDPGAVREIIQHLENRNAEKQLQEQIDGNSMEYCAATIARAELYSLLIQGFSIIYMKDFLEWARERLERISSGLYQAYEKFFVMSRINHFRLYRAQLQTGQSPLGPEHSLGESNVCYEPVIDTEHPDTILAMNAYGRATSANGVILAHEALKSSIQLLTVWAKRYENYCTRSEWLALRLLVNSPQAEIRQFALGPSLFSCVQTGMRKLGVDASTSNPDFYLFLQEWIGGGDETFFSTTKMIVGDPATE